MGAPRARPGPTRSGRATLVRLDDADVSGLTTGDVLLAPFGALPYPRLDRCSVVAVRTALHGELGDPGVEVPVVDVLVAGHALAFAPCDLVQVVSRGEGRS